jgi:hypothetical protein
MAAPDFQEGIRALLVDRDNSPQWAPLGDIDAYFTPLPVELGLAKSVGA